ncbi:hypothetical protein LTR08_003337 [Meristemomyces frigidus]|nr:hypothetical protein LTR08_003337 [Meristemomyces frigidus]
MSERGHFRFLDLPPELCIEILSYLLIHGDVIVVIDPRTRSDSSQRKQERTACHDNSRQVAVPAQVQTINALRTGPDLYWDGIETYWSGNTFVFSTMQVLQEFIGNCLTGPKKIRHVVMGGHEHVDAKATGAQKQAMTDLDPRGCCFRHTEALLLARLPDLRTLDIFWGALTGRRPLGVSEGRKIPELYCLRNCASTSMSPYYERDDMLKRIPSRVLRQLESLVLRYRRYSLRNHLGWGSWTPRDALQYAKDLQEGKWEVCPFETKDDAGCWMAKDAKNAQKARLWLEARAAEYWDDIIPPGPGPYDGRWGQWCTWSTEWRQCADIEYRELPRKLEELFDADWEVREGVA